MWDINLREKGFYKYLMPNGSLKFACLLHFCGMQQKLFTHFSGVKRISVLSTSQKPPVVSDRWDLIERSGDFFLLDLHIWEARKLSEWGRDWGALNKTVCRAGITFPIGILQHLPLLCPHQPRGLLRGILLARMQRGGFWKDKYGHEIKSTSIPGLQPAGRCWFHRLALSAGRTLQGMAHPQHSSEAARREQPRAMGSPLSSEPLGNSLQEPLESRFLQLLQQHPPFSHSLLSQQHWGPGFMA